jgi:RimJ/RimL family protein N-acetyltransferase
MLDGDRLPAIEAQRVRLRWLEDGDVDALHGIFGDARVTRYWSTPPFPDRSAAVEYLEKVREGFRRRELFQWGVARRADDAVIGTCTLARLDSVQRRAELGFALAFGEWGRGLMSEALGVLLEFAFGRLALRRVEADVDPRNAPSIRLLERLGFQREGLLRERWQVSGETQDALLLGLLAREWRGPR